MDDLSNEEILSILDDARLLPVAKGHLPPSSSRKNSGNLFFEPSTRTRMSFETAMKRLGGDVVNLGDVKHPRWSKGRRCLTPFRWSTVTPTSSPCAIHAKGGSIRQDAADVPILNGGDGAGHHPTQTMLDLFTIQQAHGRLDGLKVVLAGDLRYGRTVHSLSHALTDLAVNSFWPVQACSKCRKKSWQT